MESAAVAPADDETAPGDTTDDQDAALAVVSDASDSEEDNSESPLYWAHPTSQVLHRTTLGSALFLCGRAFGEHYHRVPMVRAHAYPQCTKCFS